MSTDQQPSMGVQPNPAEDRPAIQDTLLVFGAGAVSLWYCAYAAVRVFGRGERLEWTFYELASIVSAFIFWVSAIALGTQRIPRPANRVLPALSLAGLAFAVALLWHNGDLPTVQVVFLVLTLVPAAWMVVQNARNEVEGQAIDGMVLFLVNALGALAAISFFTPEALNFSSYFGSEWVGGFLWGMGLLAAYAVCRRARWDSGDPTAVPAPLFSGWSLPSKIALFSAAVLLLSFINLRNYDYQHSRNYVGAIFDVCHGKSLLYDTPSFYGYLNMRILALLLGSVGITFEAFTCLDSFLLALWQIAGACLMSRVWPWRRTGVFAALLFVAMQPLFATDSMSLYSTGPLRFGIGLAVCWALVCLPRCAGFWVGTVLSAVAVFWSGETAVYVAPAWLFCCLADALCSKETFFRRVVTAAGRVVAFVGTAGMIYGCIFWMEYRPGQGFPLFKALFQYAGAMAAGTGKTVYLITASSMPPFGNHYFLVIVFLLGLALTMAMLVNRSSARWFWPLAFVSIHNVAVLAHFVGHSEQEYAFNIAGFAFIEFALVCRILQEEYGMTRAGFWRCFGVPVAVFCALLLLRPVMFLPVRITVASQFPSAARQLVRLFHGSEENPPLLRRIMEKYSDTKRPVAIISNRNDTKLFVEAGMTNALCLNPLYNLAILPDGIGRFVEPAVAKMEPGTILLVDRLYLDSAGRQSDLGNNTVVAESMAAEAILDRLGTRFTLEELGSERDDRPGYQELETDPPYVDLVVFRLTARS